MIVLPLLLPLVVASGHQAPTEDLYIGTYTSMNGAEAGGSKGIYYLQLDPASGKISTPELAAAVSNPSYLAIKRGGKFAYAVDESSDSVSAFAIQPDHRFRLLNSTHGIGGWPCFVSVTPDGRDVLTAGYREGTLASMRIQRDGAVGPIVSLIQDHGAGPNKDRQDGPHMHVAIADSKNRHVYSCDLGTDDVEVYDLDSSSAHLVLSPGSSAKAPAGAGPRHIAIQAGGKVMYVNNEMGGSVTSYAIDAKTGGLKPIQTISTLPEGVPAASNRTAEIAIHPNGKWLYVSNRGDDSMAIFSISATGGMELIDIQKLGVMDPRGFDIDPSGKWIVVAGQLTNDVTVWSIDPSSGKISTTGQSVPVGVPVCVAFVR
jgi:6-phosphogluconolactonase